jgi:hypothetical protein
MTGLLLALPLSGAAGTGSAGPVTGQQTAEPVSAQRTAAKNVVVGVTARALMTDVDDTDGRLDVRAVGHRLKQTTPDRVRVSYRVTTFRMYRDGLLASPAREFVLELHRTRTRGADRNITVSSESGRLVATVISNATREAIGVARIKRLNGRTVSITGSRQLIGARSYFLTSNYHLGGSRDCGWQYGWPVTCQDTVPDSGWMQVDRMGWPATG